MIRPPDEFPLDRLTFLGMSNEGKLTARKLNSLHSEYSFDVLLTLFDITTIVPDKPFQMPVVGWVPLHSEKVRRSSVDYWPSVEWGGYRPFRGEEDGIGCGGYGHGDYVCNDKS